MPSNKSAQLDPRMVRTADALLSVAEALLTQPWPLPDGDITGFLRAADLSITAVDNDGGQVATPDGLVGTCSVVAAHLSSITFLFDRLRSDQLGLATVITDWFSRRFGAPFDSGPALPHSLRWRIGEATVVLDRMVDPEPCVVLQICRDEEVTELGAAARAMTTAVRVFAGGPRPTDPAEVTAWFARAGVRPLAGEPGQGLIAWTTRRLTGHWTGTGVPDEIYLTAHGEAAWLDQLAYIVQQNLAGQFGSPVDEDDDPEDGTRLVEWTTPFASAGVLRSAARGITGIFVGDVDNDRE